MTAVYISGPMRGYPAYNFAAFQEADAIVGDYFEVSNPDIFNPAWQDIVRAGRSQNCDWIDWVKIGEELEAQIFDLRRALGEDTAWICSTATDIVMLAGWEKSSGARAEKALAEALGLNVWYLINGKIVHIAEDPQDVGLAASAALFEKYPALSMWKQDEVMSVSSTGAMKGTKPEAHHLIPREGLDAVARHYGKTAVKYPPHNWRAGYDWSKSYDALIRHATAWWSGEDNDPELDSPHLAAVAWHALTLLTFADTHSDGDDRYKKES